MPCVKGIQGNIIVPGDKSIAHRLIFFAAMAKGTTHLEGVSLGKDILSSLSAIESLGVRVVRRVQEDGSLSVSITGVSDNFYRPDSSSPKRLTLSCGNSGTTARLLAGLCAGSERDFELCGDASLSKRPMGRLLKPLSHMGVECIPADCWPIRFRGSLRLQPATSVLSVASAQIKTALIFAGLQAEGASIIVEPSLSRNHTEKLAPLFGAHIGTLSQQELSSILSSFPHQAATNNTYCGVRVVGKQQLVSPAETITVPKDPSSAAFWAVAAALIPHSSVSLQNVCLNPTRLGFVRVMKQMGVPISIEQTSVFGNEAVGTIHVEYARDLFCCETTDEDIALLIDEIPALSLLCARGRGTSVFRNVGELRYKESDRLSGIIEGLSKLGVNSYVQESSRGMVDLVIEGVHTFCPEPGCTLDSKNDHRLACTWAIAQVCCDNKLSFTDSDAVAISYPNFLNELSSHVQ